MKKEYTEEMKNVIQSVCEMADNLDAKGIGANIPVVGEEDGMHGAIKTDILLFLFRVLDHDRRISPESLHFINECLGYRFTELTIETLRKRTVESTSLQICALLPYFILVDKLIGNCKISTVYVQTLCYMALGFIGSQEATSLEELVRYHRYASACMQTIEEILNAKMDFDPLCLVESRKKDLILSAVKTDQMLHKSDEDPVVKTLEEQVRRIAGGKESAHKTVDDERIEIQEPDLIKDPGDGSDLPDDTMVEYEEAGEMGFASALEEMDALIGLDEVKAQVKTLVNVFKIRKKCGEMNIRRPAITMHMVFTGNPGTGKTAMARILGKVYKESGLLSKGHAFYSGKESAADKKKGAAAENKTAPEVPEGIDPATLAKILTNPEMASLLKALANSIS